MDTRVAFWTGALINMALVVGFAVYGVRQIRRGQVDSHRRSMRAASSLIVVFLVSYVLKRLWIGPEDLDLWGRAALINLWVHETMVAGMLIAGGMALVRGRRLARTRRVTGSPDDPKAEPSALQGHRRVGRIAVICSILGWLTACGILAQIFGVFS
ncbi:MAG: DUF420 domain-containing protein [Deltaproteobacteria bacterium]|nr:DUF420 domain-containing protein [Deltaproteobacteria bacterium]